MCVYISDYLGQAQVESVVPVPVVERREGRAHQPPQLYIYTAILYILVIR